jgi:hypothetical protein
MMQGFADPDSGGPGWRLVLTLAGDSRHPSVVRMGGREIILLPRAGEGWWAVDAACTGCQAQLTLPAARAPIEQLPCADCGRVHVPAGDDSCALPLMVVDDEVYLLCD